MLKNKMFKKSVKKYVCVFSLCCNLLLIKFIVCDFAVPGVVAATINEHELDEVQHLKSELAESLNNDSTNVAAKGVIVQPFWTQDQDLDKSIKTESAKVEINAQNRNEAAALRAEIEQAVAKDTYATTGVAKLQDIKVLEDFLKTKEKGKEALITMTREQNKHNNTAGEEYVGSGSADSEDPDGNLKAPNVITANMVYETEIDIRKLQRLEVSKRRTRELLVLKYIEEDFSFKFGAEVNEWKHIVHAGQEYFIGRRVTDLLIVRKETAKYEQAMVIDVGHVISYIETYNYWNLEQQQQEGVIIIAAGDKLLWYRVNQETNQIELYWAWMVGSAITGLTYFSLDSQNYLAISSNQSFLAGHYALNIYQYKLETKEFWIVQRLQLVSSCQEVTVLDSGRDVILAIPQNNTAEIYTFNPHEFDSSHIRFQLKRSIAAEGVLTIAGFKMGGHSYLAVTGYQPQILFYHQGDFVSKTILGHNFGLVELFFPIPIRTYRDDLLLLVQHRVDFATHSLTVVETLIWDGEAFETSIPVPCHLGKHVVYGVGCMLDLHRNEGLKGAALLKNGKDISVIVPRYKAESGLFRFHTELLAKNSELVDLQEIFNFLKDWVKEQDDLIAQAEAFLEIPNEKLIKQQPVLTAIESLKTPEFEFNGQVGEIYVNEYKWTVEDSNIDLELLIQDIEDLERSFNSGRQRRNLDAELQNELDFDEVVVENLELENLNGQPYFIQNGELNFEGLVNFSELEVLEKLRVSQKRQVQNEDLILEGDLEFDKINGVNWSDIKNNLIFSSQKQNLEEVQIKGEIFVEDLLTIDTLNSLNFPDDFMLSNGPLTSTVKAEKHFVNTLSVSSVDTDGYVNGKNPLDAITLTDAQDWQGTPTFKYLEVAEILELHGQVVGRSEDTFPQNPSLQETNIIEASCHFNELVVNGPLVMRGLMDEQPLGAHLKDIILKSSDSSQEILVPSLKSFDAVTFPKDFHIENNTINEIPVNEFVTLHTKQFLNITALEGYIYFYNLTLNGSYDGVKIEEILEEVILLENPIDLSTTELIFPTELKASSITILDSLNKKLIKNNLQTLQENLIMNTAEFESLHTLQADFSHDIMGQGKLNNIELHDFVGERSWHEPPMRGNIFLNELILEKGIQTDELHGIRAEFLLDFLNQIDDLPDMVLNGRIQVDHITITGDVQLHKLNGLLFEEELQLTTIKLQHPNFLSTNIIFKNRLDITGQLNVVGDFRGNYLPDVIEDIVIRSSDACLEIKAPKSFLKPVEVLQNTQVRSLNGIQMDNMARKSKHNHFNGSLQLKGNLVVRNINLQGLVNDFNWQEVQNLLYFDEKLQNFVLKNTIQFETPLFLEDLTVMGDLNEVENLPDFIENLIYKNQLSRRLKGKNTFTGRVTISNGAYITNLNGQDLVDLFNNLVLIDDTQPIEIYSPVTFEQSLHANEIQVEKTLIVEYINGCSVSEWLNNSLRVDQDQNLAFSLQFAAGSLDGNSFAAHYLNDVELSRIVTLNTPQVFNETVKFSKLYLNGFISCKGQINNLDLEEEYNNTLLTYGDQHIFTALSIQSIQVLGDLVVRGLVNSNKDLQDLATLQEDLVFESPIYFQSLYSPQVIMHDLVTGIDFNEWFNSAVKNYQPNTQPISGNWSTKYLRLRTEPQNFQYQLNVWEPWPYYSYMRLARNQDTEVYKDKEICLLMKKIWRNLAKKPVFVKYIEESFDMILNEVLKTSNETTFNKVFYLQTNQEHFLLINFKCQSVIYKWLAEENKFLRQNEFQSGPIDEIHVVPAFGNNTGLQFITNFAATEKISCSLLKAVNKWKLENDSLVLANDLPAASDLLYKTQGNDISLWTLYNETIQELDLDYKIKQKWQLPLEQNNNTRYRFVPLEEEHKILLTNGQQLVLLSSQNLKKKAKKSHFNLQEPPFFQTTYLENLNDSNSQSLLKPNSSLTSAFVFANFQQIVARILTDLGQRLNQQVNITQLSIPESDLVDEHLVPDFLALMEELRKQTIYPPELFNISFANIMLPENPAQVLATRVVQLAWPVSEEITKMHSYLRSNENHDHHLCSNITTTLGLLIKDILRLANEHSSSQDAEDYTLNLSRVIERIRTFGKDLESFIEALKTYKNNDDQIKYLKREHLKPSATNRELKIFSQNQNDLMLLENSHLPGYKQGEILSLAVGSTARPRRLWAITNTKTSLATNNNNPGIYVYLEGLKGQLYQFITAIQPRSLQQLRIKQETLLLFIQDCCQVQILKYRGSLGFTTFAEINSKEYIKQILTITLPSKQGHLKHLLILLLKKNIKFYEFVTEGYDSALTHIPWNC